MKRRWAISIATILTLSVTSCAGVVYLAWRSTRLESRDAVAALLPKGLHLKDRIPISINPDLTRQFVGTTTIERELVECGATIGADSKLRDRRGLEIVFVEIYNWGWNTEDPTHCRFGTKEFIQDADVPRLRIIVCKIYEYQ